VIDRYRHRLKHAAWTWRESKMCRWHRKPDKKDRASGRNDKRGARHEDRAEMVEWRDA
jgi:hypothetical protein